LTIPCVPAILFVWRSGICYPAQADAGPTEYLVAGRQGHQRSDPIVPVDQIRFHPALHTVSRQQISELFCCDDLDTSNRAGVARAFSTLTLDVAHLKACSEFTKSCYERCEIASTNDWVLLALCWDDCSTEIHDHDESECGFKVLEGELVETRFAIVEDQIVREIARRRLSSGTSGTSNRKAIHQLATLPGERAMSLHAYSPALDCESMNVYQTNS
jgi:hypothetical protein